MSFFKSFHKNNKTDARMSLYYKKCKLCKKKNQHLMFIPVLVVSNYDCISDKCLTDFPMMAYIMAITI